MSEPDDSRGPSPLRLGLLWAAVLATAAAATAAAVVAWRTDLGQQQARVADAVVTTACCAVGALILSSRPRQPSAARC